MISLAKTPPDGETHILATLWAALMLWRQVSVVLLFRTSE